MTLFKSICAAAALISIASLFLPKRAGVRKATVTAFSLIFLLAILPRGGLSELSSLLSLPDTPAVQESESYEQAVKESFLDGVKQDLCSRFDLDKEALSVESDLSLTAGEAHLSYLHILLGGKNFFADVPSVLRYVEGSYGVDCEVKLIGD